MSFALKPSDGSARLLAPARKGSSGQPEHSRHSEKVQGAIQAIQRFAADIRKEAGILTTARNRSTSAQHIKQVAGVARDTVAEARRWLQDMDAGSQSSSTDEQKLQHLKHQKLSENLDRASSELEQSWKAFAAADSAWVSRQASIVESTEEVEQDTVDVERGQASGLQLQEADLVAQAEVDMHTAIADEYAREITQLSQNMQALQRGMVDLAEHTRAQGESLEGIEANMGEAAEKTSAALEQMQLTDQSQRKGMRWTYGLLVVVAVVSATMVASVWH